jgi:hypothetical protein
VTIYATASGQIVWDGISTWYRVSPLNSNPLYIYGGLIATTNGNINTVNISAPSGDGKIIVVSISQQELDAYDNGKLFVSTPVTTGQSQLPTPTGTYHFFARYSPYTFVSPWPVGSPFYYGHRVVTSSMMLPGVESSARVPIPGIGILKWVRTLVHMAA